MSEPVQIALITGLCTGVPTLIIGLITLFRVGRVEHHTNSMKDALISGAAREGHAQGVKDERAKSGNR